MKTLYLVLLVIFFGSCTITKRHYRSGYFIQWKHHQYSDKSMPESTLQLAPDTLLRSENTQISQKQTSHELQTHEVKSENKTSSATPGTSQLKSTTNPRILNKTGESHFLQKRHTTSVKSKTEGNENPKDDLYVRSENKRVGLTILTLAVSGILAIGLSILVVTFLDNMIAGAIFFLLPIYLGMLLVLNINNRKETRFKSVRTRNMVYHLIAIGTCLLALGSVYLTLLILGLL